MGVFFVVVIVGFGLFFKMRNETEGETCMHILLFKCTFPEAEPDDHTPRKES